MGRHYKAEAAGEYVPRFPRYLRGITCGAIKKNGQTCGMITLGANGRCKFHKRRIYWPAHARGPRKGAGKPQTRAFETRELIELI